MNVLFFMTDQYHADCFSFLGHPVVKTPNLDKLAARSAWFSNMYTCTAICAPSRTSFMTGTYLRTHGHFGNAGDLQRNLPSLPEIFAAAGWRTGVCGKNHTPHSIFRHFHYQQHMAKYAEYLDAREIPNPKYGAGNEYHQKFLSRQSHLEEKDYKVAWTADRAVDFITDPEALDRPWFLWCSFAPPHAAHDPPAEWDDIYNPDDIDVDWEAYHAFELSRIGKRAMIEDFWKAGSVIQELDTFKKAVCRYLTMITMVDKEIGRILDVLEQQGQADDTIVVFTADHGDFAGHWGQLGKNIPGYDDLLRIPFIYYDPRRQDCGRCVNSFHQSIDLMPALLEALDMPVPPTVQGESILPALDGYPGSGRNCVYAETHNIKTVRNAEWKLNFYAPHPHRGQLFRMFPKPDEINNLWDDPNYAHIKQQMLIELSTWMCRCEQADSMEWKAEEFMDTRWYNWLREQPHQAEDQEHPRNYS